MPAFKLGKVDRQRIEAVAKRLEGPSSALMAAIKTNNEAIGELRDIACAIESDWQAAWEQRSERWQGSTVGESVSEATAAWAALADDLDDIDVKIPEIVISD
jgi:hypothetical protein